MALHFEKVDNSNRKKVESLSVRPFQINFIESVTECMEEADMYSAWHPVAIYDDANLVGFSMYGCFTEEKWGKRVWLDRLLIDQKYQGKGYGKKSIEILSRQLFDEYDTEQIYLSVYDDNPVAIRLYEKAGFEFNGELDTKGEKIMVLRRDKIK